MLGRSLLSVITVGALLLCSAAHALANGGPFLVRRPNGDPAAKGVVAPVLPDLMPGTESRLEVVREDLTFRFTATEDRPLVHVTARYTIRNPGDQVIRLRVGFPILRGIYVEYRGGAMGSYSSSPAYRVEMDGRENDSNVISTSTLFDRIRGDAWKRIVAGMDADPELRRLRARMAAEPAAADVVRTELVRQLTGRKWDARDAALLADLMRAVGTKPTPLTAEQQKPIAWPENAAAPPPRHTIYADQQSFEQVLGGFGDGDRRSFMGALTAIGELKATQLLSHLADRFAPGAATGYERVFSAWGGDVREQAVDPASGALRPRRDDGKNAGAGEDSLYARLDYFEPGLIMEPARREACARILKNLPVVFTFAPMNIIISELTFRAGSTHVVTYDYSQYAFDDAGPPASHQLAYVVHPASFWKTFGPIHVTVQVPRGLAVRATMPLRKATPRTPKPPDGFVSFVGDLREKTGELYLAVERDRWRASVPEVEKYRLRPPALKDSRRNGLGDED